MLRWKSVSTRGSTRIKATRLGSHKNLPHKEEVERLKSLIDIPAGSDNRLMLVALDADTYGDDLVWEVSRGGADFPHIYHRPMLLSEVVWARPMPLLDGRHVLDLT